MMTTDPIADMLTRIRNGLMVGHESVEVPASKMKDAIAKILLDEGYIKGYEMKKDAPYPTMVIALKYGANKQRAITGIKRVSKPGLRVYVDVDHLPKVLGGLGVAIISTSKGVMTDKLARAARTGREVLAYVW